MKSLNQPTVPWTKNVKTINDPLRLVPRIGYGELAHLLEQNLERLDLDQDGIVSLHEVNLAIENPSFMGQDAVIVILLKVWLTQWHSLRIRTSISQLPSLISDAAKGTLKRDQIGILSNLLSDAARINTALAQGYPSPEVEANLAALKTRSQSLAKNRSYQSARKIEMALDYYRRRLNRANRSLYGGSSDPLESISYKAVQQGRIGDCMFLAKLAAMAAVAPQAIAKMVTDNGNGTFTVIFPRSQKDEIVVGRPTEQELMLYAAGTRYGIWPAVLEKACGLHCRQALHLPNFLSNLIDQTIPAENIANSLHQDVLADLDSVQPLSPMNSKKIHYKLVSLFRQKNPILAVRHPFGPDGKTGIRKSHAYAVVDYQPLTKVVTVYNPWGCNGAAKLAGLKEDPKDDGILKMSLDSFLRRFNYMIIYEAQAPT